MRMPLDSSTPAFSHDDAAVPHRHSSVQRCARAVPPPHVQLLHRRASTPPPVALPHRPSNRQGPAVLFEIAELCGTFLLGRLAHLEPRDELAEILIAFARLAKQRETCRFCEMLMRQPRRRRESLPRPVTDTSAPTCALIPFSDASCEIVPSRRSRYDPSSRARAFQAQTPFGELFRLGASLQKREGTVGVELDVAVSHRAPPHASLSG